MSQLGREFHDQPDLSDADDDGDELNEDDELEDLDDELEEEDTRDEDVRRAWGDL